MDYTKFNSAPAGAQAVTMDQGMRSYMLGVFNYMTAALALTGIVALSVAKVEAVMSLFYTIRDGYIVGIAPLGWVVTLAPLALAFVFSFGIMRMKASTAQILFWVYAAVMGASLSSLFYVYTGASIARVFFISASVFGAMSLYGYTTKKDLTGFGSFLMMGLIGIILASIVNMFLHSSGLEFAVSILAVLIFTGLTAYDTQQIKALYYVHSTGTKEDAVKISVIGALKLYMDFINLFISLLRFFGDRR